MFFVGLVIGGIVGVVAACVYIISGNESQEE